MSSHEAYLRSSLAKYRYPDIAKRDILGAVSLYGDLRPKMDAFIYNDGSKKDLLSLEGTIPVNYRGSTYNIPICVWVTDTHPYNPPMVYVRPTSTMMIKAGNHVDGNGKVYLPYLHEWKHPQSDLQGLIQVLAIVFGENPPVFSRQPTRPAYTPGGASYPPALAAAPAGLAMPAIPNTGGGGYTSASSAQPYGYPPQGSYPPQASYPPTSSFGSTPSSAYPGYPAATQAQAQKSQQSLSDDQIKASLVSAVEDKMKRRLREIFAQAQAEMDVLKKTEDDLTKGKQKLEDMMNKLEGEQNEVERNVIILREKDEEMKQVLQKMENREELDIDEAIVPTAPLYKQLLNTFAEEQATEDAIYYFGEALRRGVIDLDVFLKQVRELSTKQFMLRALIQKCREKAGLPDIAAT